MISDVAKKRFADELSFMDITLTDFYVIVADNMDTVSDDEI